MNCETCGSPMYDGGTGTYVCHAYHWGPEDNCRILGTLKNANGVGSVTSTELPSDDSVRQAASFMKQFMAAYGIRYLSGNSIVFAAAYAEKVSRELRAAVEKLTGDLKELKLAYGRLFNENAALEGKIDGLERELEES